MRIYGIDASLKSTGVSAMDFNFHSNASQSLIKILINPNHTLDEKEIDDFYNSVTVVIATQIQAPKVLEKELAKRRKKIRDDTVDGQPSYHDLIEECRLVYNRMHWQCSEICKFQNQLCPNLSLIEDYSFHSQGSLVQLAEMKGFLSNFKSFNMLTIPINNVKKVGSTKGNGNKNAIYEGMKRFPLKFTLDEKRDDEIDAMAICLSGFYAIYHRTIGFDFPKGKTAKEKTKIKSWVQCLDVLANRIGNKAEMEGMINAKRI